MNPRLWDQVEELFAQALELPLSERDAFLGAACTGEQDLKIEVESLLLWHTRDNAFLDTTAHPLLGSQVGAYQISEELGRGGMGEVYLALRSDRLYDKKVAIKILGGSVGSFVMLERFYAERKILAGLDHPNIVKLLDGGTTETGLPYIVMDYVEGVPLDDYCRLHELSVAERLKLFRSICSAVHYAHQNLIVHRDLKPGNILVTAPGVPKLLDFGIAKLVGPRTLEMNRTATVMRVMTPGYASPEQVRGEVITTASDVYSLGVLLYELLTGQRPYDVETGGPAEMERKICESEPQKPSAAVLAVAIPAHRQADELVSPLAAILKREGGAKRLGRRLTGDLDNIVLMALRKEPARRYASAEQMSEDIRRHLEGLPIDAHHDTLFYRLSKFVRRNRLLVSATALVALILVVAATVSLWQAQRAQLSEIVALDASAEALLASNRQLEGLVSALKAERQIHRTPGVPEPLKSQSAATLQKLVYSIRQVNRLEGHSDWVSSVAFSPNGKNLASASREVILWDLDGRKLQTLRGHGGWVNALAYSPDGKLLMTGSRDKTVRLWRTADGTLVRTFTGHRDGVYGVAFSSEGKLASSSKDGTVKIWDAEGALLLTLIGHQGTVYGVAFSPNGKVVASGGRDQTVRLWDAGDGRPIATLKGHTDSVRRVAFSPDGKRLVSGSYDKTARLWSAEGKLLHILAGHNNAVWGAGFTPDGETVATGSDDFMIRVWSRDGQLLETLPGHSAGVNSVAFSPDGALLASAGADKTVRLWSAKSDLFQIIPGNGTVLNAVRFSPDGQVIATASNDRMIRLYSLDGTLLHTLIGHTDNVRSIDFSPNNEFLISTGDDRSIRLWSRDGRSLHAMRGNTGSAGSLRFSPDQKSFAFGGNDGVIRLWSIKGKLLHLFKGDTESIYNIIFSPDGRLIASSGSDGTVRLWRLDGTLLWSAQSHSATVPGLSFSPDGRYLVSGGYDKTVRLWDLQGKCIRVYLGHTDAVNAVEFSRDGKWIVSTSSDRTVRLWDLKGNLLREIHGHNSSVLASDFSPNGVTLATASSDGRAIIWNLRAALGNIFVQGCSRAASYLKTNSKPSEEDRHVCDGISIGRY